MVHIAISLPVNNITLTVKKPLPTIKEVIASPVMSVKKWREQLAMERAAGTYEDKSTLVSDLSCDSCQIFIGRDHEEQELYLFPLLRQYAKLRNGYRFYEHAVFHLCGDCAGRKGLPASMMFFGHTVWQTRRVVFKDEVTRAENLLYSQVMGLWRMKQPLPPWSWWSQWIPPLVLSLLPPIQQQPVRQHAQVPGGGVQGAIGDVDSLLRALS